MSTSVNPSINGPDGSSLNAAQTQAITALVSAPGNSCLNVVLWGDSGVNDSWLRMSITADNGNESCTHVAGLATYQSALVHQGYTGAKIWIVNVEDQYWYGEKTIETIVSSTSFTFRVDSRATPNIRTNATAVPNNIVTLTSSWRFGRNNPAMQGFGMAGFVPASVVNLGANAQTAQQMASHIAADLAAYPNHKLWVCTTLGANDVRLGNSGVRSLYTALFYAKQHLLQIKNAGRVVLYLGWMPNGAGDTSKDNQPIILEDGVTSMAGPGGIAKTSVRFNTSMRRWCAENGIDMISQYEALVDPASTSGYAIVNTLRSDDTHVGHRGSRLIGSLISSWLTAKKYASAFPLSASLMDRQHDTAAAVVNQASAQIFANPLLATSTGGAGVNVATGVAIASTGAVMTLSTYDCVARTVVNDGDVIGYNQQAVFTYTGAAKDVDGKLTFTIQPADVVIGGKIIAALKARNSLQTKFQGFVLQLTVTMSGGENLQTASLIEKGTGTDAQVLDDTDLVNETIFTPVMQIPNDGRTVIAASLLLQGYCKATTVNEVGAFTVNAGRPAVYSWA